MSNRALIELAGVALVLIVILNVLFFPVIWGKKTLLSSAHGTASILPTGAYQPHPTVWLSPPKTNDPGGVAWFSEPNYALLHDEIFHDHQLPLWNPYCGCGVPWLANMQSQVLNPLQALAWLVRPSPRPADLYLLARLLVAGLLMFLFLRQLLSFVPSLCGAVAYMQTGYMIIYIGMPDVSVCAYLPGLFWAAERLLRRPNLGNVCLLSVLSSLTLVAGMPEVALLSFIFLAVYVVARLAFGSFTQRERYCLCLKYGLSGMVGFLQLIKRRKKMRLLISQSRDGEIIARALTNLGFLVARGSSGRGAVQGAKQLMRSAKSGESVVIMVDGPRGPIHEVKSGSIRLAEMTGLPIIPCVCSARHYTEMWGWDKFMCSHWGGPKNYIYGEPIFIPRGLDDAARERYCNLLSESMTKLRSAADSYWSAIA